MALSTAQWKSQVEAHPDSSNLIKKILEENPPTRMADCRADPPWAALFRIFSTDERSTENLDFLDAVDSFNKNGYPDAEDLYNDYVKTDAEEFAINLSGHIKDRFPDALQNGDTTVLKALIDEAYAEVSQLIGEDTRLRFVEAIRVKARPAWQADEEVQAKAYVSVPREATKRPPDNELVVRVNQQVLKDLPPSSSANFYQAKDLLIIAATGKDGKELDGQHGLEWIQDQAEFAQGKITVIERGGAFGRGKVRVEGVADKDKTSFEAAFGKVSKKEITYA